jgi:hypothetical protein
VQLVQQLGDARLVVGAAPSVSPGAQRHIQRRFAYLDADDDGRRYRMLWRVPIPIPPSTLAVPALHDPALHAQAPVRVLQGSVARRPRRSPGLKRPEGKRSIAPRTSNNVYDQDTRETMRLSDRSGFTLASLLLGYFCLLVFTASLIHLALTPVVPPARNVFSVETLPIIRPFLALVVPNLLWPSAGSFYVFSPLRREMRLHRAYIRGESTALVQPQPALNDYEAQEMAIRLKRNRRTTAIFSTRNLCRRFVRIRSSRLSSPRAILVHH